MGNVTADAGPVIFLMGPTASGKTDLAVDLVQRLPLDIISVDSALVYRGMDIGTSKPDAALLSMAPHRLIDICDPAESYSAAQFRADALRAIDDIRSHGRIPLLVGGTMLYFRALSQGLSELPSADPEVRRRLDEEASVKGWSLMHEKLRRVDPNAAQRIHPNDPQRIQRALEVYEITGTPMSELLQRQQHAQLPFSVIKLGLAPSSRGVLHERIATRFQKMLGNGFVDEVAGFYNRGDLTPELPSMRAVGYRQIWEYLDGAIDEVTMKQKGIVATRQLAKRQMTWMRAERDLHWLESDGKEVVRQALNVFRKYHFM